MRTIPLSKFVSIPDQHRLPFTEEEVELLQNNTRWGNAGEPKAGDLRASKKQSHSIFNARVKCYDLILEKNPHTILRQLRPDGPIERLQVTVVDDRGDAHWNDMFGGGPYEGANRKR